MRVDASVFLRLTSVGLATVTFFAGALAETITDTAGDKDCFGTDKPVCELVALVDITQDPEDAGTFDVGFGTIPEWGQQEFYEWTHEWVVPDCGQLQSATLTILTWDL